MARSSPSVPHTTPAMVPKCSSRLISITESFSVARGEKVRSASHPATKERHAGFGFGLRRRNPLPSHFSLTRLQQKTFSLREQTVVHEALSHLRSGARLDPEIVDLVCREVVQVHLEGKMTWLNPLGLPPLPSLAPERRGSFVAYGNVPCTSTVGWLNMVMPPHAHERRPPRPPLHGLSSARAAFCRVILLPTGISHG